MGENYIYTNYFEDVNPGYEKNGFKLKDRKDPDEISTKLYDALYKTFFYDYTRMCKYGINCAQIRGQKFKGPLFYSIFLLKDPKSLEVDFILSSDYIGPSINQMKLIGGYRDFEIKNLLRLSRTLGGHILWPRGYKGKPTINQVRGGEIGKGYGFYDRIDWTLFLLKTYYFFIESIKAPCFETYCKKTVENFKDVEITEDDKRCFEALYKAFEDSCEWFKKFGTFKNFCDFFLLKGSFVDETYEVLELTTFFPIKPVNYCEYVKNNIRAINDRNELINNKK